MKNLFLIFFLLGGMQSWLWAQCTVISNNGSYSLNVYLNPTQVIPQQSNCQFGYDFKISVNYVITASPGYSYGDILDLDGEMYCYGGTGAGIFPLPLDTASGQVFTTIMSTNSTSCATDTPNDLLCDGFMLHINAKMVSSQYLYCVPAIPLSTTLLGVDITPFGDDLNFKWSTATESNTSSYLVEHLFDKGEWGVLDKKRAQGFSEKTTHYQSKLVNAAVGNHYFKLSEIDLMEILPFLSCTVIINLQSQLNNLIQILLKMESFK